MSYSQKVDNTFIKLFSVDTSKNIIKVSSSNIWTYHFSLEEVLKYFPNYDTAKISFYSPHVSMETGEVEPKEPDDLNEFFPKKCFCFKYFDHYLIAYSLYKMKTPKNGVEETYYLIIVDNTFHITDKKIICITVFGGMDYVLESLINPQNEKLFIIDCTHGKSINANFELITVEDKKFKIIHTIDRKLDGSTDNIEGYLNRLGWKDEFFLK